MVAVVLPTWLSLCWDRLTHAILFRGFLPEVFRKRKASKRDRCHSFFLLVYNFYSSKRLLRIRFCHSLAHQLILENPLKTYLTRTERRQESNRSGSNHHVYDCVKPSRQRDQKLTRSLKPVRSSQNAFPKVQNQWNPKGNRGISRAPSGWDSALPRRAAWCPSAVWELRWHLPPCLAKNRTTSKIHRTCR